MQIILKKKTIQLGLGENARILKPGHHVLTEAEAGLWFIPALIQSGDIKVVDPSKKGTSGGKKGTLLYKPELSVRFDENGKPIVVGDFPLQAAPKVVPVPEIKKEEVIPKVEEDPVALGFETKVEEDPVALGFETKVEEEVKEVIAKVEEAVNKPSVRRKRN
jgi:hypothetical protein